MTNTRRWIAPGVIAFTAVSLLGSGVAAAGDLRADERREAAERLAEQQYRDAVRPIVESVFDHAQPLGEAARQNKDDPTYFTFVDVATDATASRALQARRNELKVLTVPPRFKASSAKLDAGIATLQEAAKLYSELPFALDDDRNFDVPAEAAELRYDQAASAINGAVLELFPQDPPAVPLRQDDNGEPQRRPVSRGSYLLQVSLACGRSDVRFEALPENPDGPAAAAKVARDAAVILRDLVSALTTAQAPAPDSVKIAKDVVGPVKEFGKVAKSFDRLAVAALAQDVPAIDRELVQINAADRIAQKLSGTFRGYGSDACAESFAP